MKDTATSRLQIYGRIRPFIRTANTQLLKLGTIKLLLMAAVLSAPYLFKLLIDDVMIGQDLGMLPWIIGGYVGLFGMETVLLFIQTGLSNRLIGNLRFKLQVHLWKTYARMPSDELSAYSVGDLKTRADSDVSHFGEFIQKHLLDYAIKWLSIVVNVGILLVLNWKLALFGFVMIPLSFVISSKLGKRARGLVDDFRKTTGKYESWLTTTMRSWKEVRALNLEKKESIRFVGYWKTFSRIKSKHLFYTYLNELYYTFQDDFINKMNMYFVGGLLIFNGEFTIGGLLVFLTYYQQLINLINDVNTANFQLNEAKPSIERVIEMLNRSMTESGGKAKPSFDRAGLELRDVSFAYSGVQGDVLRNVSLSIGSGEHVAIVGRSGSGKSTLVKLLLGLHDPQKGTIVIGNHNIQDIDPAYLHRSIGVVMQDYQLFDMSVRDNLLLANPRAKMEEIRHVCRISQIDTFIETLEQGYDTPIGEGGAKLSGGQRQRLAIARTLLTNPKVLILDEATSALDGESEGLINRAIGEIAQSIAVIVISHRYSSIRVAERVLVLDKGRVVADGHHSELQGYNEYYDLLFAEQRQGIARALR